MSAAVTGQATPAGQTPGPVPPADVDVSLETVRELLAAQRPDLAQLAIGEPSVGWDNYVFPLGEKLAVRLPRRASAVPALLAEARWAEEAGWGLSLPVPVPSFTGEPGAGYPYPWLVTQYFPGTLAAGLSLAQRDSYAEQLAGFLVGLHRLAPLDAPENAVRGVGIEDRRAAFEASVGAAPAHFRDALAAQLQTALNAAPWHGPARWLHGDPHPANLVALQRGDEARLVAAIDLSDLTSGDPASDLGIAQAQFSSEGARRFRAAYGRGAFWADAELWDRAGGWRAHFLALMHSDDSELGAVAREVLAEG